MATIRVSGEKRYLVYGHDHSKNRGVLKIEPSGLSALQGWKSPSRISPIWPLNFQGKSDLDKTLFDLKHSELEVIFAGPFSPVSIIQQCPVVIENPDSFQFFCSLGMYNSVILVDDFDHALDLRDWLFAHLVPSESWRCDKGDIIDVSQSLPEPNTDGWRKKLQEIFRETPEHSSQQIEEFVFIAASTLARAETFAPSLVPELDAIIEDAKKRIEYDRDSQALLLEYFANLNAAFSRFSSQAFSGVSPIQGTECHFWTHSLLGTGTANIALRNLIFYIHNKLQDFDLRRSFLVSAMKQETDLKGKIGSSSFYEIAPVQIGFKKIKDCESKNNFKPLKDVDAGFHVLDMNKANEPSSVDLTYFSGRDGFRQRPLTLSAPLAIVSSCNSMQWSLMTITHEICHAISAQVCASFMPTSKEDLERLEEVLLKFNARSRQSVLDGCIASFHNALASLHSIKVGEKVGSGLEEWQKVWQTWFYFADEILTHSIDFLYFYGRDVESYISSIWISWSVIPDNNNKVYEHVVRSISAVLSGILGTPDADYDKRFEVARDMVVAALENIPKSQLMTDYVTQALELIEELWSSDIREELAALEGLLRISRGFLYSDELVTKLLKDQTAVTESQSKSEYMEKSGVLTAQKIENPIYFLKENTKAKAKSEAESLWMLYKLAFDVEGVEIIR